MKEVLAMHVFLIMALGILLQSLLGLAKEKMPCNWHKLHYEGDYRSCYSKDGGIRLFCSGGLYGKWEYGSETVRVLILCEWPDVALDPQFLLQMFPTLRKLTILNSNVTHLSAPFPPEARSLEKVNLTNTRLQRLPDNAFSKLPALRNLDLRNNALTEVDPTVLNASSLRHVYLSGNPWKCALSTAWILNLENGSVANRVVDRDKLLCSVPYDGRPLVPVVEIITALKEECERTVCDCELVYVVGRAGGQTQRQRPLMVFASVNCSHRGLVEMPPFLPANTTTLRLSGNKITDLTPLAINPVYKGVLDVYLDDNLVESIALLEGSYWLDHFRVLSLRNNRLSDLPTYALENVLLQSGNAVSLYLGNNPWRCDCLFTPGFQDLLIRYTNLVKDINDVKCFSVDKDDNFNKQIRDLTRTAICISPEDSWLQPLDVLNAVLASLIFLILGKLLYDYWSFKKTGKLPWIVAKIP